MQEDTNRQNNRSRLSMAEDRGTVDEDGEQGTNNKSFTSQQRQGAGRGVDQPRTACRNRHDTENRKGRTSTP